MVQFQILNGKKAGAAWLARHFPVRIGRAASADLCVDEPGVWDQHLEINLRADRAFEVVVPPPALAGINGQPIKEAAVLHNGDIIELGSLRLRFGLSPVRQRSLRPREILTWAGLAALCLGQVALIYSLL